jgi:hypothetical protein
MKLEFAFLADAATLQDNGLFAVVSGGFDVIESSRLPAVKHAMALIGRVRFEPEECGRSYSIKAEIVAPNGAVLGQDLAPVLTIQFFQFPHPRYPERSNVTTFCFNYQGVSFHSRGDYKIRLVAEARVIGEVGIEVIAEGSAP